MPTAVKPKPVRKPVAKTTRRMAEGGEPSPMVWYIGNFVPPHSTENHVARALENVGAMVGRLQESDPWCFANAANSIRDGARPDMVLWTRTGWDWGADHDQVLRDQRWLLRLCREARIPTVGYHLDIWWGLKREPQVFSEPFFEVSRLFTADGGHNECWKTAGINHTWYPPGISEAEAQVGTVRGEFRSRLAFVGSHDGGYHPEHAHRHELVRWLRTNFRRDCAFYPQPGQPAVRGKDLQDLYASVDVVVGDSCFAGAGLPNYWSDRVPETLGRGGYLIHPDVPGLTEAFPMLPTWRAFDWDALGAAIERGLDEKVENADVRLNGRLFTIANHTYEERMKALLADVLGWSK